MKTNFKFQPVAWMTAILGVLQAVLAANEALHLLPASWTPWLLFASAFLTALLGRSVWERVTPLARPRDAQERPLVPKSMAAPAEPLRDTPRGYVPVEREDLIP